SGRARRLAAMARPLLGRRARRLRGRSRAGDRGMRGIITPAPIRKSVHVTVSPARAFAVFTANTANWWLKTHSISRTKSPIKDVVIEPRAGGRWFERGEDGSECDWGKVLEWQPPSRLLLA